MKVTPNGIFTETTPEAPERAPTGIFSVPSANTIERFLQPAKALSPIAVTLEGIVMLVRPLQPLKAEFPISVTPDGITKLPVRPLQFSKA